jgi:hypothetical protein
MVLFFPAGHLSDAPGLTRSRCFRPLVECLNRPYKVTMKLIAFKDLKQPRRLKERLLSEKELLLTSNGRPIAVILNVDDTQDPEVLIRAVRDARSRMALTSIREAAAQGRAAGLTLEDINREIVAYRSERRAMDKR